MASEPVDWNVVVNGAWNRAILTPDGIRKRLFKLAEGTPIQIEVAIDRPGSFRVIHDGVVVVPGSLQLEIQAQSNDLASLIKASNIATVALNALPETPVAAAGMNFKYTLKPLQNDLIDLLKSPLDDAYSDAGFAIAGTSTQRSLDYAPGVVNVEITQGKDGEGTLLMNFHYASTSPNDLCGWLAKTEEFWGVAQKLLNVLKIPVQQED